MNYLFVILSLRRSGAERVVVNISNELIKNPTNNVAIYLVENKNEYQHDLDSRIRVTGGDVQFQLSLYKKNKIKNMKYINFVNDFNPDVVHSHLYLADILSHSFYYKKAIYISHLHNSRIEEYDGLNFNRILQKRMWTNLYEYKWLIKKYKDFGTCFIACSKGAKKLYDSKIKVGKVITLPNAIPIPQGRPNKKKTNDFIQLIWIGRLNNVKRPQMAIEIAKRLKENGVKFELKIVGDGDERNNCDSLINKYILSKEVKMLGVISDLQPIYEEASIMIHTSVFEGLPMVFIEAGSYGIPIITTDCMPNNEFIEDEVNGKIIKTEEPADFVEAIDEITSNSQLYRSLSENAIQNSKEFGMDSYIEELINFYKSILD